MYSLALIGAAFDQPREMVAHPVYPHMETQRSDLMQHQTSLPWEKHNTARPPQLTDSAQQQTAQIDDKQYRVKNQHTITNKDQLQTPNDSTNARNENGQCHPKTSGNVTNKQMGNTAQR